MIGALASRTAVFALLAVWAAIAATSPFWLAPGPDDGFYFLQVVAFVYEHRIAIPYLDEYRNVYTNLPGYPAAQGLFFAAWSGLGLTVDVFSSRAFQSVSVFASVGAAAALLHRAIPGGNTAWAAPGAFLVMLGVTPFGLDAWYLRPEPLGLLAVAAGMLCFARAWETTGTTATVLAALSGLLMGVAMTTHPTITFTAGLESLLFAGALLYRRRFAPVAAAIAAAAIPLAWSAAYFLAGGAPALAELLRHGEAREFRPGGGILAIPDYITAAYTSPSAATLYQALPFAVLSLVIFAIAALAVVRLTRPAKPQISPAAGAIYGFFACNCVYLALDATGRVQVFTVFAFSAALCLSVLLIEFGAWRTPAPANKNGGP